MGDLKVPFIQDSWEVQQIWPQVTWPWWRPMEISRRTHQARGTSDLEWESMVWELLSTEWPTTTVESSLTVLPSSSLQVSSSVLHRTWRDLSSRLWALSFKIQAPSVLGGILNLRQHSWLAEHMRFSSGIWNSISWRAVYRHWPSQSWHQRKKIKLLSPQCSRLHLQILTVSSRCVSVRLELTLKAS